MDLSQFVRIETPPCGLCDEKTSLLVPRSMYMKWIRGAFIDRAFDGLSIATRELLKTGTHDHCHDVMVRYQDPDATVILDRIVLDDYPDNHRRVRRH